MVYILILLFLIFNIYKFDYLQKKKAAKYTYSFTLICFVLLAGLRYRIGVDSIRYETHFDNIPELFELQFSDLSIYYFEPFFVILESVIKTFTSEFYIFQLVHACFVNIVIFSFIKKNTKNVYTAILIYYVCLYPSFMFEIIRESYAVAFFLLSCSALKKSKWIKYYVFSIIAFMFHTSAIIVFIFPLFKILNISKFLIIRKRTIILLFITFIIGYIIQDSFFDIIKIIEINEKIANKASSYSESLLAGQTYNINGIISVVFRRIIYPFLAILYLNKISKSFSFEYMVFLGFIVTVLSIPISILYRFNSYFFMFSILCISEALFYVFSNKSLALKKNFAYSALNMYLLLFPLLSFQIYGFMSRIDNTKYYEYMRYYPYSSILTKDIDNNREAVFNYYDAF